MWLRSIAAIIIIMFGSINYILLGAVLCADTPRQCFMGAVFLGLGLAGIAVATALIWEALEN